VLQGAAEGDEFLGLGAGEGLAGLGGDLLAEGVEGVVLGPGVACGCGGLGGGELVAEASVDAGAGGVLGGQGAQLVVGDGAMVKVTVRVAVLPARSVVVKVRVFCPTVNVDAAPVMVPQLVLATPEVASAAVQVMFTVPEKA
jgi:hypothetical protein